MSLISNSYYGGLRAARVPAARRRFTNAGVILCYHDVVASVDAGGCAGLHERQDRFERQMRWLRGRYEIVALGEFVRRMADGGRMGSMAAVTFDDGYAGVFEHAVPVLESLGVPATVFIVADAARRRGSFPWDGAAAYHAAGWTEIRAALGRWIEVGVHSATHPSLPLLTDRQLQSEVVASREAVGDACGIWPQFFAYPFGHWNEHVRDAVRSAGYAGALTLDFGLNRAHHDRWALRRINVPAGLSDAAFEAWVSGCRGLTSAGFR